jgi:hypothetical protein
MYFGERAKGFQDFGFLLNLFALLVGEDHGQGEV